MGPGVCSGTARYRLFEHRRDQLAVGGGCAGTGVRLRRCHRERDAAPDGLESVGLVRCQLPRHGRRGSHRPRSAQDLVRMEPCLLAHPRVPNLDCCRSRLPSLRGHHRRMPSLGPQRLEGTAFDPEGPRQAQPGDRHGSHDHALRPGCTRHLDQLRSKHGVRQHELSDQPPRLMATGLARRSDGIHLGRTGSLVRPVRQFRPVQRPLDDSRLGRPRIAIRLPRMGTATCPGPTGCW